MSSFTTVSGCVLVNDILKTIRVVGGGKSKKINSRFDDLGIPVGYFSTKQNNRVKNTNIIYNNETQPYDNTVLFDHFIKKVI